MSLKKRIVARLNRTSWVSNRVYVSKHGPAVGLKRQGGMGWLPSFMPGMYEGRQEMAFLDSLPWHGLTVYDVGGDQGLFALFFAHRVGKGGQVVVFEPNPRSRERIERNVRVNNFRHVRMVPLGLGEKRGTLEFTVPLWDPSRGTAIAAIAAHIVAEGGAEVCQIEVDSMDSEIRKSSLPAPHFIKIDIEGMEYPALRGMRETLETHRPRLFIEVHGCLRPEERAANIRCVVGFLEDLNYRMRRIESDELISRENVEGAQGGHYYCEPMA